MFLLFLMGKSISEQFVKTDWIPKYCIIHYSYIYHWQFEIFYWIYKSKVCFPLYKISESKPFSRHTWYIQEGAQVIIGLKLNIRNMSSVTMLEHINFHKNGLVIIYLIIHKKWLNRLNLLLLDNIRLLPINVKLKL